MLVIQLKKTDYNTKVTEIENNLTNHNHDKYIDTSGFTELATDVFNARLTQANLITKTDLGAKLSNLNRKVTSSSSSIFLSFSFSSLFCLDESIFKTRLVFIVTNTTFEGIVMQIT